MKKLLLLLLALPLVFAACSDDDDKDASIVGTFVYASTSNSVETDNAEATESIQKELNTYEWGTSKFIFNADNTYKYYEGADNESLTLNEEGTYSIKGNIITYTYTDEGKSRTYDQTFDVSATTFTIHEDMISEIEGHPSDFYDIKKFPNLKIKKAISFFHFNRVK